MSLGGSTVYTYADWLIVAGREDEFVEAWTQFVDWSLEDGSGALGGMLLRDSSDPRRFISIGPWTSAEAAQSFFTSPELQQRSAPFRELADRFEPRLLDLQARRGEVG
jgi:heme-degrading monooxygenase HmoA